MRRIKMKCSYALGNGQEFYGGATYDEDKMPEGVFDRFVRLGKGELIEVKEPAIEVKMDAPKENKAVVPDENKQAERKPRKRRLKNTRK